ncbi:aconitase family protein [Shigella flexneri]
MLLVMDSSALWRYFVPPHIAVIDQYMREIDGRRRQNDPGSDSHTRYGALGTMAVGEGGGELVKQLLNDTWDIDYPGVVAVHLTENQRRSGAAGCGAGYHWRGVQKRLLQKQSHEFVRPGVSALCTDFRNSVDVMTTETTC